MFAEIIDSYFKKAQEKQQAEGYIKLERGFGHDSAPWYRRLVPLSLPLGWCYALPRM